MSLLNIEEGLIFWWWDKSPKSLISIIESTCCSAEFADSCKHGFKPFYIFQLIAVLFLT